MLKSISALAAVAVCLGLQGCTPQVTAPAGVATSATVSSNQAFSDGLPWADESENALASQGFIATLKDTRILAADGRVVFDAGAYDFAEGPAPDTMNPSLWRHLGLLNNHGLFEVTPGLWQVRGLDISVMSIIATETGYIIVDPLTATETAAAAMSLVREHIGDKPIVAVIYTHSHGDHFGGVKGIVSDADVTAGKVQIIAPEGFMEHAVSENLIAGPAMSRRANYQFGTRLTPGPAGQGGAGIGTGLPNGSISLIAPTQTITETGQKLVIDGIEIEFQVTPGTEAPAEMNFYLPHLRALCLAENANPTMHNILPPRGALVRDSKAWADYLTEALHLYGARTDVMFVSHGWPRWGQENVAAFMSSHRDAYKYLHDQSVRLMNKGYTAEEIAEVIALPGSLASKWYNRGYYGTMAHNSKAVYQRYLGWYDANPANLNPWPPEEAAVRYVKAMGGKARALRTAQTAFNEGDYRWAAEVASHLVFADDTNTEARELLARAFEQMGYQAEGSLWRNMYLTGAAEARVDPSAAGMSTLSSDVISAISVEQVFDLLAVRVDPQLADGKSVTIAFVFPDLGETRLVSIRNSVLVHEPGTGQPAAATLTMPKAAFLGMIFAGQKPADLVMKGALTISGDPTAAAVLLGVLDPPAAPEPFPIVTP
ncbi:alkyl/aryl-sulfatase [Hyphomonas sp.]|uniref:alkyl/aryl-sulfatase n=1 Tax=Hyphomonas sp. TaxID=87 RepID=UPI0037BF8ED0